jgi:hypothetical protein
MGWDGSNAIYMVENERKRKKLAIVKLFSNAISINKRHSWPTFTLEMQALQVWTDSD